MQAVVKWGSTVESSCTANMFMYTRRDKIILFRTDIITLRTKCLCNYMYDLKFVDLRILFILKLLSLFCIQEGNRESDVCDEFYLPLS